VTMYLHVAPFSGRHSILYPYDYL